jgi:hypothetical protein
MYVIPEKMFSFQNIMISACTVVYMQHLKIPDVWPFKREKGYTRSFN